jgi:hypothetical protein
MGELLAAYAPSFEIEVKGDYDRFGALRWRVRIRCTAPRRRLTAGSWSVYAHPAWTLYRDRVLLQLVYTIWFPERPPASDGDLWREAGRHALARDAGAGRRAAGVRRDSSLRLLPPVLSDAARAGAARAARHRGMDVRAAVAAARRRGRAAGAAHRERHALHRARTLAQGIDSLVRYELRPYGELRSMQRLGPGRASAFGATAWYPAPSVPSGLLYWPMGIVSAGAMRQWGRQATAFIGRRHFDDADLFEKALQLRAAHDRRNCASSP